jgi:hypothetical protein
MLGFFHGVVGSDADFIRPGLDMNTGRKLIGFQLINDLFSLLVTFIGPNHYPVVKFLLL